MTDSTISTPETLLRQRYGQGPIPPAEHWNPTADLLIRHSSLRAFRSDPVPDGIVELAVAAAQSASTSQNIQPWSVVAVRDRERVATLAQASLTQKGFVATVPLYLVWLLDLSRLASSFDALGTDRSVLHNLDPLLAGTVDTSLAAQNAAIYLESVGLGIVYIGALRYMPELVISTLGLPPHVLPLFGMCVGYPAVGAVREIKPRLPQPLVLHHETYQTPDAGLLDQYIGSIHAFRLEQDMSLVNWTHYSVRRFAALQERVRREGLEQRLRDLGFGR